MDYSHRRHRSVQVLLPPELDPADKVAALKPVVEAWRSLEADLLEELQGEGFAREQITLHPSAYIRYYGQLEDVEVSSPVRDLGSEADVDQLLEAFETLYARMYTLAARPAAATFHFTEVCVVARVETVRPVLRSHELQPPEPDPVAHKGRRRVFQGGQWQEAEIWRMEALRPGNHIEGLAVVEASNTTLFVPPEWRFHIDAHDIYWLQRKDA